MKRVMSAVAMAGIGLWSASVFAQGRNFGGSWTIDQEKTMAAAMSEVQTAGAGAVARSGGGGGVGGGGGARSGGGGGGFGAAGASTGGAVVARSGGGGGMGGAVGGGGGGRGRVSAGPMSISLDSNAFTVGTGENNQVYRLDGTPTVTETPGGRSTSKASWKDDKLVVETTNDTPNGAVSSTIVWYLEGDSLVRETHSNASGQDVVRKTYYKRSSSTTN